MTDTKPKPCGSCAYLSDSMVCCRAGGPRYGSRRTYIDECEAWVALSKGKQATSFKRPKVTA